MRLVGVFVAFSIGVALPSLALADVLTFTSGVADYENLNGTPSGLYFHAFSIPFSRFVFSNPMAPTVTNIDRYESIQTGPLVEHTDVSWKFAGGTLYIDRGQGGSFVPLPSGYSTCEAAGLQTAGSLGCSVNSAITGNLTGDVTFSVGPVLGEGYWGGYPNEPYALRNFDLTGAVTFDIDPKFAIVEGVGAGPYLGTLRVVGQYRHALATDPDLIYGGAWADGWYNIQTTQFELTGITVPEPSALPLLITALGLVYRGPRRRALKAGAVRR